MPSPSTSGSPGPADDRARAHPSPDDDGSAQYSAATLLELATLHARCGTAPELDPGATAATCDWLAERCSVCEPSSDLCARAIAVGRAAVARYACELGVVLSVARMYLAIRATAECHVTLMRALQLAPGDPRAIRLLGELFFQRGDWRAAVDAFALAAARGTTDAGMWAMYDGICLDLARDPHPPEPTREQCSSDLLRAASVDDARDTEVDESPCDDDLWDHVLGDEEVTASR